MFHYGNNDPFIPEEKIAEVEQRGRRPARHDVPPL